MQKKFYTIDDLYAFCKENKFEKFSSAEKGAPLIIQSLGTFESSEDTTNEGLMNVKLKSCHTGINRNKSGISDSVMEQYKNSFKGRPILGAIYKTDTGEYEFRAHDVELVENGEDVDINYIEQPIGFISQTAEPYLEFDEKMQKNYLMVSGTIFSEYSRAAEILQRRKTCKCSVEIAVEEMSYDCKEDYLSIDKFRFSGVSILGYKQDGVTEIQEGMEGSKITIEDFSTSNSVFNANTDYQKSLVDTLDKLNNILSSFNKQQNNEEGGKTNMKLEELLNKYEVKLEDLDFETEGLTDEELETAFEEFACKRKKKCEAENEETTVESEASEDGENSKDSTSEEEPETEEKFTKTFSIELSQEETNCALYNLISQYDETDNECYFIRATYDDYFIMQGWFGGKLYKQGYKIEGSNVALEGERQEMFELILSESEKIAIEKMRGDYAELETKYSELVEFKKNYDAEILKAQKDEILNKTEYDCIRDTEEFKNIINDAVNFSVEEISTKADLLFAAHIKTTGTFSANLESERKPQVIKIPFMSKKEKKSVYGNLFNKD